MLGAQGVEKLWDKLGNKLFMLKGNKESFIISYCIGTLLVLDCFIIILGQPYVFEIETKSNGVFL